MSNRLLAQIRNLGRKSQYTNETLSQVNGDESHRNPLGTFSQIFKRDRATEVVIMEEKNFYNHQQN